MMGQTMMVKRTLLLLTALATLVAGLVAQGVMAKPAQAAFPGENGKIAFTSDWDGNDEIYVMNKDGSGTPTNLTNEAASDLAPAVSPDGTKIAFTTSRHGNDEIYVMNADGSGTPTRLTNNPKNDTDPTFSPDGSKIAFRSFRDGNEEVYVMSAEDADNDANGDNPTRLTNNSSAIDDQPDWGSGLLADQLPPTISGVTPTSGQAGVARNTSPTIAFSEEMNPDTLSASTAKLYKWNSKRKKWQRVTDVAVGCDNPCQAATLNPYPSDPARLLAANNKYKAVVTTGAKDKAGNALTKDYSWTFRTGSS